MVRVINVLFNYFTDLLVNLKHKKSTTINKPCGGIYCSEIYINISPAHQLSVITLLGKGPVEPGNPNTCTKLKLYLIAVCL